MHISMTCKTVKHVMPNCSELLSLKYCLCLLLAVELQSNAQISERWAATAR